MIALTPKNKSMDIFASGKMEHVKIFHVHKAQMKVNAFMKPTLFRKDGDHALG